MLEHTQAHCITCQRPRLFVRSTYDMPHAAHLMLVCALGLGALIPGNAPLAPVLILFGGVWILIWAAHTLADYLSASVPFRCHDCGSPLAPAALLADLTEQQRLKAAMAKATAKGGGSA